MCVPEYLFRSIRSIFTTGIVWFFLSLAFRAAPIFCALLTEGGTSLTLAFVGTDAPNLKAADDLVGDGVVADSFDME